MPGNPAYFLPPNYWLLCTLCNQPEGAFLETYLQSAQNYFTTTIIYFYFMCWVLCWHVCMFITCLRYTGMPEESIR